MKLSLAAVLVAVAVGVGGCGSDEAGRDGSRSVTFTSADKLSCDKGAHPRYPVAGRATIIGCARLAKRSRVEVSVTVFRGQRYPPGGPRTWESCFNLAFARTRERRVFVKSDCVNPPVITGEGVSGPLFDKPGLPPGHFVLWGSVQPPKPVSVRPRSPGTTVGTIPVERGLSRRIGTNTRYEVIVASLPSSLACGPVTVSSGAGFIRFVASSERMKTICDATHT